MDLVGTPQATLTVEIESGGCIAGRTGLSSSLNHVWCLGLQVNYVRHRGLVSGRDRGRVLDTSMLMLVALSQKDLCTSCKV